MDEVSLYEKHFQFHSKLDYIATSNLSRIKEISKRINFASISTDKQVFNNKGNLYHREKSDDIGGDYISNLTLDYTIQPKVLGVVYGLVNVKTDEEGEVKANFKKDTHFNNYARFISDLISDRVVYSDELESFIIVKSNAYEVIDETKFALNYPVDNKHQIDDFLQVMLELYREHLTIEHGYNIHPHTFAGNNWVYDCAELNFTEQALNEKDLYAIQYPVEASEVDTVMPNQFFDMVTEDSKSKHNLKLIHAYTIYRKMKLVQAEKWFLMKDFGRSGKGLLLETFEPLLQVNKVNFDSLLSPGFESTNEWMNFHGADVAHANETGEITKPMMRILRKIASAESITGRGIGRNSFKFKNEAVLILDTNESVDTGDITANTTRTVKISLKDRPKGETSEERYKIFKPYWDHVMPNGKHSPAAAVSFLIASLEYLKQSGREFSFYDVTLKNYFSEDDLTATQRYLLVTLSRQDYIPSGDVELQDSIREDYGKLSTRQAQIDMKKIGVLTNQQKWIEGSNIKIHKVNNQELFDKALKLLNVG